MVRRGREKRERERERERVREREETERERREKEEREKRGGEERERVETCDCVRVQCPKRQSITELIVFFLSNRPRPDFFRYLRQHTSAYMPNSFIYLCVYMSVSK